MLLSDFQVVPSPATIAKGSVVRQMRYLYAISSFGQGYNIVTSGGTGTGTAILEYNWSNGSNAEVRIGSERYGVSERTIYGGRRSDVILQLSGNIFATSIADELLLSMFVVNHHYAMRTGPFLRKTS